jgi:PST family polysaccharide transporter
VILSFFVGIWWNGVEGLALLYGLVSCALLVPGFLLAIRGTFVTAGDVFAPVLRPALLAPVAAGAAWAATTLPVAPIVALVLGLLAALAVAALAMLIPAYREDARRLIGVVARARRGSS